MEVTKRVTRNRRKGTVTTTVRKDRGPNYERNQKRRLKKKLTKDKVQLKNVRKQGIVEHPREQPLRIIKAQANRKPVPAKINNTYLHQLIAPESAPSVGIPDRYERMSTVLKPYQDFTVNYPTEQYGDTAPGTFLMMMTRRMDVPLFVLEPYPAGVTNHTVVNIEWNQKMLYGGMIPIDEGGRLVNQTVLTKDFKTLQGTVEYTIPYPNVDGYMFKGTLSDGTIYYGIPGLGVNYSGEAESGFLYISFDEVVATAHQLTYEIIDSSGVLKTGVQNGTGTYTMTIPTIFDGVNTGNLGMPGVGIRIKMVDMGGTAQVFQWGINTIRLRGYVGQILDPDGVIEGNLPLWMKPYQYKDRATFEKTIEAVRPIGLAMTTTFIGSPAYVNGKAAGVFVESGDSGITAGLWSYDQVGTTRGSCTKELQEGLYSYMVPNDNFHMEFCDYFCTSNPKDSYIIHCGLMNFVGGTPVGSSIKVRIVGQYECISVSQLYTYNKRFSSPLEIEQAQFLVRQLPTTMGNPEHVDAVKKILRKAGEIAVYVGKTIYENRALFGEIAMGLLSLL